MTNPIIPRSKTNPVGQSERIRLANSALRKDIAKAQKYTLEQWAALPVARQNRGLIGNAFYDYLIDIDVFRGIINGIANILGGGSGAGVSQQQAEAAYYEGRDKANGNLAGLISDMPRQEFSILRMLGPVQRRAALVGARVFELMQGFQGDTAADLGRVLSQAIQDGTNPNDVARIIRRRFAVSASRAERIARTEITGALRRGRWDEAKDVEEKFGVTVALLHYSALISGRTRASHARRHGIIVMPDEQAAWYAVDGNGINCLCSSTEITLDADGKPMFGEKLIERMKSQRQMMLAAGVFSGRG